MDSVATFFKEENDFLYRKGKEKASHAMVENLIKFGFTDEQAAEVVEVDVAYVKRIRTELNKK
jgi:hypothetical protein